MNTRQALARIEGMVKAASHRHAATDAFVSGCPKCAAGVDAGLVLSGATDALALLVVELGKALAAHMEGSGDIVWCLWAYTCAMQEAKPRWRPVGGSQWEGVERPCAGCKAHAALLAFAETLGEGGEG